MEGNKVCNWLLYYSSQESKTINSANIVDIESSSFIKRKLCSSICYFDCGRVLFDDFPDYSTGFVGIFDYLSNDKRRIIERLKDEDLQAYITKLINCENFAMRYHVKIIKCLMKRYACQLAPWDRIKRALDAICATPSIDNIDTYQNIQQNLILWLRGASIKGLQRLFKSQKNISELEATAIIDNSAVGSLILYAMMYYAPAKMIKYTVPLPDPCSQPTNGTSRLDVAFDHSKIVIKAFGDICDNKDMLPLQTECLRSRSMDPVLGTLTIALIFHWTFGNSLRNLENLLKMSTSSINSETTAPSPNNRPQHLPLQAATDDNRKLKAFFMTSDRGSDDSLRQIFSKGKDNGTMNISADGDSSPEIFHTPTDDIPASFANAVTPAIKLLSFKPTNNVLKPISDNSIPETIPFSLKAEFQKRLQQKQPIAKPKPIVSIIPSNETTWMAQSTKNEVTNIPLTPKKSMVPSDSFTHSEYSPSLTKGQLSEIQMKLSLSRQKIVKGQKSLAKQTEKSLEDSKQKVFFQALHKTPKIVRRKSLETFNRSEDNEPSDADKRLSMFIARTEKNLGFVPLKRFVSKEKLSTFTESEVNETSDTVENNHEVKEDIVDKESESPMSLRGSEVTLLPTEICMDPVNEILIQSQNSQDDIPIQTHVSTECCLVDIESLSRKNSSTSISGISNSSHLSSDRNLVTKEDYQKSIDILSTSLTSLQEEIRFLSQQQLSWNNHISHPAHNGEVKTDSNHSQKDSEDQKDKCYDISVADTPTNIGSSSLDVSDSARQLIQTSISLNTDDVYNQEMSITPIQFGSLTHISYTLPKEPLTPNRLDSQIELIDRVSPSLETSSIDDARSEDEHDSQQFSPTGSMADNDGTETTSSSESIVAPNVQPVSFVIEDNQVDAEAKRKKAELLAKREQRRLLKLEIFRQRREEERENRLSANNGELLERELKKKLEQEKRDSLLKKYLDRKNEEKTPNMTPPERRASSTASTPIKSVIKSNSMRASDNGVKQDSVENLSLASPHRNGWFSSIRQNHRMTSSSTTNLGATDSTKFGVPLPPQEYLGPKLFGKRKVKTNRSVIANAIAHCCLAGSVNVSIKETVLKELADAEGTHFMILFRDHRCQYRSLYVFDLMTEELNLITGTGPKRVTHEMVEKFYKYNSGTKQFNPILSTKHLSPAVDAICIQSIHWNQRGPGQGLSGAVSTTSISQPRSRR